MKNTCKIFISITMFLMVILTGLMVSDIFTQPFTEDFKPKIFPGIKNTGISIPTSKGSPINISVTTNKIRKIYPGIYGNNAAIWQNGFLKPLAKERMKKANISIMRFPGGSKSAKYFWNGIYPPYAVAKGWNHSSNPRWIDTDEFFAMCEEASVPNQMITVNHGYVSYNTTKKDGNLANATALAADWVEYCNTPNDGSNPNGGTNWAAVRAKKGHPEPFNAKYWEVGNEVYGKWVAGHQPKGSIYGTDYVAFYDAMKAVDPSIYIGLVVEVNNGKGIAWSKDVISAPGVASRVDFLIHHDYFIRNANKKNTPEQVLASASQIIDSKNKLDRLVKDHTSRTDITYSMSEYNSTGPKGHHNVELTSGLFIAKALGLMAQTGFHSALFWLAINVYWDRNGGGTHGFLTEGDPSGVPDYTPYPNYYPFYLYTRNFGDWFINSTSSDSDVYVFASKFSNNNIGMIIVNEDPENHTVNIDLNIDSAVKLNAWILTGDKLTSKDISFNGEKSGYDAGGPADASAVPFYYAEYDKGSPFAINIEKYSVTSLLIDVSSERK